MLEIDKCCGKRPLLMSRFAQTYGCVLQETCDIWNMKGRFSMRLSKWMSVTRSNTGWFFFISMVWSSSLQKSTVALSCLIFVWFIFLASICFFMFLKSRGGHKKGGELPIKLQDFVSLWTYFKCARRRWKLVLFLLLTAMSLKLFRN